MDKKAILADLKARGQFDTNNSRDKGWQEAFTLYHRETRTKLCPTCHGSYNRLRNWLQA